jgi:pimeloyl-ACP methyl ester carboxylesterase
VLQPLIIASVLAAPLFANPELGTGIRLRYAEQGNPANPAVILLHGYTDSWRSWSLVMPGIPADYHVLAPDLRGHGDSERPAGGYHMRALAIDVLALMDAKGIDRATVVGHSMGSLVAQQMADLAPHRVERMVLIGAGRTVRNATGMDEFARAVSGLRDPVPARFAWDFQMSTVHLEPPAQFMDQAISASLRLPARVWRATMTGMLETPEVRGGARMPVLILWGEQDAVFGRAEQDALLDAYPGARLVAYAETGHAPHWERPERVISDLRNFLPPVK